MWMFAAHGKRKRGRAFVGVHAIGHLKGPGAAEASLPPASGGRVVAAPPPTELQLAKPARGNNKIMSKTSTRPTDMAIYSTSSLSLSPSSVLSPSLLRESSTSSLERVRVM